MKKILIVEDSKPILNLHRYLVKKAGFEPVMAETFAEVKALAENFDEYFCAIIDYSLPDAPDGEAIPYILARDVPGIVMTGMLDDKTRDTILSMPVVDYITKESKQAFNYLHHLILRLQSNVHVKILVVDDSAGSRAYIKHLLERHNYNVVMATSGDDALAQLQLHPEIKLVITDKEMPNMDGLELCNAIRAKYTKDDIAIIGLSGIDNPSLTAKFIKNGANDFLKKPFCPEEFYCRVLQNVEFIESIETITRQANTDYLTGLYNRRYFFETVEPSVKSQQPQTLAMMDIDLFKSINDNFGHDAGDDVLRAVSALLKQFFGNEQVVARLGGEEFSVFFADMPLAQAETQLEAFRQTLADTNIVSGKRHVQCTMSIGVTHGTFEQLDQLLIYADELLYQAKQAGRNRVIAR